MKKLSIMAALLLLATTAGAKDNIDYVDPFIGTTNYSVCNPGSVLPHALMSVVPFNVMGQHHMSIPTLTLQALHMSPLAVLAVLNWVHFSPCQRWVR